MRSNRLAVRRDEKQPEKSLWRKEGRNAKRVRLQQARQSLKVPIHHATVRSVSRLCPRVTGTPIGQSHYKMISAGTRHVRRWRNNRRFRIKGGSIVCVTTYLAV